MPTKMMTSLLLLPTLMGCHSHFRLASPQIQRPPDVTCIVLINGDINEAIAKAAIEACKSAATARHL